MVLTVHIFSCDVAYSISCSLGAGELRYAANPEGVATYLLSQELSDDAGQLFCLAEAYDEQ